MSAAVSIPSSTIGESGTYPRFDDHDTIPAPPPADLMTYERASVQFEPLVRKLTRRFRGSVDHSDIRQEAYLGLFRACDTWREGGMTFLSWATIYIRHFIGQALQRIRRRGLTPTFREARGVVRPDLLSFDAHAFANDGDDEDAKTLHDVAGSDATQANELGDAEERAFLRAVASSLSGRHRIIVDESLRGKTHAEIATLIGLSRARVGMIVLEVVERTRKRLGLEATDARVLGVSLREAASAAGLSTDIVRRRLSKGMTLTGALATPRDARGRRRLLATRPSGATLRGERGTDQ